MTNSTISLLSSAYIRGDDVLFKKGEKMKDRIKVIDSYPGSGKTRYSIQEINKSHEDKKIIFITPYLDEVARVIRECPDKHFVQPDKGEGEGSKSKHLVKLIMDGKNIVSTHALFSNISDDLIDVLRSSSYTLYLDEVFQTVDKYNTYYGKNKSKLSDEDADTTIEEQDEEEKRKLSATQKDMDTLLRNNLIKINDDYSVSWCNQEDDLSKYPQLRNLAIRNLLYWIDNRLLLWTFPVEVFREGIFDEIIIMTHMFDYQLQAYYYKYFDIEYTKYIVYENDKGEYCIKEGESNEAEREWRKSIKRKIKIVEDSKLNKIGDSYRDINNNIVSSVLSKTWYRSRESSFIILKNNLVNYFVNHTRSKSSDRLWTCFKPYVKKIKSKNVTMTGWVPINMRATNDYKERTILAYLVNKYVDPCYQKFFGKKHIGINNDMFALSELIQWIWRSAIREGKQITLYIPSQRMRELLKEYLNS
jgi:hypothetical protein